MISADAYAKTNPALCSLLVWNFIKEYEAESKKGVEFPLLFIVLPIVMSKKYEASFHKTNKNTGFYRWIDNNPQVVIQLNNRLTATELLTKKTLEFASSTSVIKFSEQGTIHHCVDGFRKKPKVPSSDNATFEMLSNSKKLGAWCGQVDDTKEILKRLRLIK
ncbi:three component ABC system middle component [Pseudoalteromonas spongiae]|uniref:three component ABC system middle component n=1 Tax=Pseudoalteromonas spongiae TaxID=298657 RepID=UPI000C2D5AC4|nr:three component ABC system middle component [Pseudoalteromonas spongiae]